MNINLPEQHVGGTFASGTSVNFSKWAFILDFIVHDDRQNDTLLVVDRVRLDPSSVQDLLAILAAKMTEYEAQYGDPRA